MTRRPRPIWGRRGGRGTDVALDPPPPPPHAPKLGDRGLFPELAPRAYLNHAAISPPSSAVRFGVEQALSTMARIGVAGFGPMLAQRQRLKGALAGLIGAAPEDIALVPNTSAGLSALALCYPWRAGDRVVLFAGEFPSNVTPWQQAARVFDVSPVFVPIADLARPGGPDFARLDAVLAAGARVVAISAVQFQTGLRAPLAEIAARCHAAGAELCVDGIQAVGACPFDVEALGVDYLVTGGQKWLMGPEGAGFAWARPEKAAALVPRFAGWMSHVEPTDFLFAPGKLRYDKPIRGRLDFLEPGAANVVGYGGLEGAVGCIARLGVEAIFDHIQRWHDAVEPAMVERGFTSHRAPDRARRSGVLSFTPPLDLSAVDLAAALDRRGVAVSTPEGLLRLSPHWPNALAEVDGVLGALDESLAALRR